MKKRTCVMALAWILEGKWLFLMLYYSKGHVVYALLFIGWLESCLGCFCYFNLLKKRTCDHRWNDFGFACLLLCGVFFFYFFMSNVLHSSFLTLASPWELLSMLWKDLHLYKSHRLAFNTKQFWWIKVRYLRISCPNLDKFIVEP